MMLMVIIGISKSTSITYKYVFIARDKTTHKPQITPLCLQCFWTTWQHTTKLKNIYKMLNWL